MGLPDSCWSCRRARSAWERLEKQPVLPTNPLITLRGAMGSLGALADEVQLGVSFRVPAVGLASRSTARLETSQTTNHGALRWQSKQMRVPKDVFFLGFPFTL